jgi:N-hydroxyarylamine O-acetyltransferase
MPPSLRTDLVDRVLERLGLPVRPDVSPTALADLYERWCRRVPFDNIRKLIHVRANDPRPLPGDTPNEFFEAWLKHGTGATCWAGNGALCELLTTLGFDARRAAATMMVAPDIPPNHGSVVVHLDGQRYVVDASMLFVEPLPLRAGARIAHAAWGVDARDVDGHFTIRWNLLMRSDLLDCRYNLYDVTAAQFTAFHEATRTWSPFNFGLNLNVVHDDGRIGATADHRVAIDANGTITRTPFTPDTRRRFLIDEVGISEETVAALPPDIPMPPPPGSRSAAAARI